MTNILNQNYAARRGHIVNYAGVVVLWALFGCSSANKKVDATATGDTPPGEAEATAPAAAAFPLGSTSQCSETWGRTDTNSLAAVCEPTGRTVCDGVLAGATADCPLLTACPADGWPSLAGAASATLTVYVRSGAVGGDGSRTSPFGKIAQALAAVPIGGTIALAVGTYVEGFYPTKDVTFVGACAAQTVLRGPAQAWTTVVVPPDRTIAYRDLTIQGPGRGVVVQQGATGTFESVVVEATADVGVECYGGTLTLDRSIVRGTAPLAGGTAGTGVVVQNSGTAVVRRSLVRANAATGVRVHQSSLTLEDVTIADESTSSTRNNPGAALFAATGAHVTCRRVVIDRPAGWGAYLQGAETVVTVEEAIVSAPRGSSDQSHGLGIEVADGAALVARRLVVRDAHELGIVGTRGGKLTLRDTLVSGVSSRTEDDELGYGLYLYDGAAATASGFRVEKASRVGIGVTGDKSLIDLTDTHVVDTQPSPRRKVQGRGFALSAKAAGTFARVWSQKNRDFGVIVEGEARLTATDLRIEDTGENLDLGTYGRGLSVQQGSTLTVTRAAILRATEVGLAISSKSKVYLNDLTVAETRFTPNARTWGMGIFVSEGATAQLTRAVVAKAFGAGILVALGEADVDATDVVVSGITSFQKTGEFGAGIVAAVGGAFRGNRVRITDVAMAGATAMTNGKLSLANASIKGVREAKARMVTSTGEFINPPISGLSDGVVCAEKSTILLDKTVIMGHARAGLIAAGHSTITVLRSDVQPSGRFGLVTQQGSTVSVDSLSSMRGSEQAELTGGDLPVATLPPAAP